MLGAFIVTGAGCAAATPATTDNSNVTVTPDSNNDNSNRLAANTNNDNTSTSTGTDPNTLPTTDTAIDTTTNGNQNALAEPGIKTITIADFAFAPSNVTIHAGDTVVWTNNDSASHTVTDQAGSFDSKTLAAGKTFSHTFTTAGTFTYHCSVHPSMMGTVVVE